MTTEDFITELFCKVDDQLNDPPKHTQALLYPSEVVTIGLLDAHQNLPPRDVFRPASRSPRRRSA